MKSAARMNVGSVVLVALVALMSAGCQTDGLTRTPPREDADAPVTSLEYPPGIEVPNISIQDAREVDLVEEMILHRTMYARFLRAMATYYTENGYLNKARWAQNELNDLRRVKPYQYIPDAEVAVSTLRPTESIALADALYDEGRTLMKKAGHGVPIFFNRSIMNESLARFKQLIDEYPNSDKIDDAAFYIAEIHKEYTAEADNTIALLWYQRAIDWNAKLPYPARFQMAVVYDARLHEREKALTMYQEVLVHEDFNKSNIDYANARIRQLTTERTRHAPAEPATVEATSDAGESVEASPPPTRVP